MYQPPYPVTDEQQEEIIAAILSWFDDFDPLNNEHIKLLEARSKRAFSGIYKYFPLITRPDWKEGNHQGNPRITWYDGYTEDAKDCFVYQAWVFFGDYRSSKPVQRFIANKKVAASKSEATNYMQYKMDKLVKRSIRNQRSIKTSLEVAFSRHLMNKYSTLNNRPPSIDRSGEKKSLYKIRVDGPFCPIEEDATPAKLVTCDYCGEPMASMVISKDYYDGSCTLLHYGGFPETWERAVNAFSSAIELQCGNTLCKEIVSFTSRDERMKRISELSGVKMNTPSRVTLEKVPEEWRPAMKAARYVDFVARVEGRLDANQATAD